MKRRPSSGEKARSAKTHPARLIEKIPIVYLGPGALGALKEGYGLLLGAQRPGWVDVLAYRPLPGASWRELTRRRFEDPPERDIVGIVLSEKDFERNNRALARELVPGDVLLALTDEDRIPQIFVHLGDQWAPARLRVSRGGTVTSARSRRRRRYS
jgi:hypothetical protein